MKHSNFADSLNAYQFKRAADFLKFHQKALEASPEEVAGAIGACPAQYGKWLAGEEILPEPVAAMIEKLIL